jgi:hypothetical protein
MLLACLIHTGALAGDFRVTDYGARGDGNALNTMAIQAAIDACAEAGGGRVVIGSGQFLCGTLVLRDHVELHLERGAVLLGSTDIAHYPEMRSKTRFYGDEWVRQSLIYGEGLVDIGLSGPGTIDGQGAAFPVTTKKKPDRYRNRPYLIRLISCRRVDVSGLTLRNSAMWMQHYLACEDLSITGIRVWNHCNKNNDMMDIDGCRNVIISGCKGDTDDDALTLKSTSPRPCENITISNCILSSHCNAIKMGTESTGGFRNIVISNCVVKPSAKKEVIYGKPGGISGVSLEVVDGGLMEAITLSDLVIEGPEVPLFIRLGNRARPYMQDAAPPGVGSLEGILVENVQARSAGPTGCSITGIPGHPARRITLRNLRLEFSGGVAEGDYEVQVPELETLYPESTMFGLLPASVLYLRHLEEVEIRGLEVEFKEADERPHLVADDVKGLHYGELRVKDTEVRIQTTEE